MDKYIKNVERPYFVFEKEKELFGNQETHTLTNGTQSFEMSFSNKDVEALKERYVSANDEMADNTNLIDSFNQKIDLWGKEKEQWSSLTNAIKVETDARIAAINALDATITTESSELITSITQTDGLVSADKKKVGDLTLGGWALGYSTVNNESIADTDTINNAFAKAQRQINANKLALSTLNGNNTTPGSVAYQIA